MSARILKLIGGRDSKAAINDIRRRFKLINSARLKRVHDSLRPKQRQFLDILPLLFHVNNTALPGYLSKKVPVGISDYIPANSTLKATARIIKNFSYRKRALRSYGIHAIYMMGSSGTIAYSEKSDFDIWLCHAPDLKESQIESLNEKGRLIAEWAGEFGLEVTFFTMDAGKFKQGATSRISDESSGTAQHHLLLEEFYRTSLLIAGKHPAWWLVPPDSEKDYDSYIKSLVRKKLIYEHEIIDFGDLTSIPPEEFFGASLWQMHKAVKSPYKSLLKLLLIESYAATYPDSDLLSTEFKQAVYAGESNIDNLDPYILMIRHVERYLKQRKETDRLETARKCFYFKVNYKLSQYSPATMDDDKGELLYFMSQEWGWNIEKLITLDSSSTWKIDRVMGERRQLVTELTESYHNLSRYAKQNASSSNINKTDLNLLGRRLYAAFERKAGKVDLVNPGISGNMRENALYFQFTEKNDISKWSVYRSDQQQPNKPQGPALKSSSTLLELLCWCFFNRILTRQTLTSVASPSPVNAQEFSAIIDTLDRQYPGADLEPLKMSRLNEASHINTASLFVNIGTDPMSEHTSKGNRLVSNRNDALSYGGIWKNLALSFDLACITSWNEILTFRYRGKNAVLDCLCDYMAWAPLGSGITPPQLHVNSFSSTSNMAIAHRINVLFTDVIAAFYSHSHSNNLRYLLLVEHDYYILQSENDIARFNRVPSRNRLVNALSAPQDEFSPVIFDRYIEDEPLLSSIYSFNLPDIIQVFIYADKTESDIYIIDENGSLFYQRTDFYNVQSVVSQFTRFLTSVSHRQMSESMAEDINEFELGFYEIKQRRQRHFDINPVDMYDLDKSRYISIEVISDSAGSGGKESLSIYCNGEPFTALELGSNVYEAVARHITTLRKNGQQYPIYITDLDVSHLQLGVDRMVAPQTIHYLNFKQQIEKRLNTALQALD